MQCESIAATGLVNAVSIFHVCLACIELAIGRRMVVVGTDDHEIGTDGTDGSNESAGSVGSVGSDVSVVFVSVLLLRICVGVSLSVLSVAAWAGVGRALAVCVGCLDRADAQAPARSPCGYHSSR